ncbi:hypothetical protein ARMSODRAFT_982909 [Armillaria solidipes]|uniref:Uncharacterized protein n=1 Tax=Armillaria solidipes TaxID=1076256 RepID=A0A2H3APQ2_9AGAR|nr:hypothetical protein ARMSODRAFT_982909 [Armillaria solidipes]
MAMPSQNIVRPDTPSGLLSPTDGDETAREVSEFGNINPVLLNDYHFLPILRKGMMDLCMMIEMHQDRTGRITSAHVFPASEGDVCITYYGAQRDYFWEEIQKGVPSVHLQLSKYQTVKQHLDVAYLCGTIMP